MPAKAVSDTVAAGGAGRLGSYTCYYFGVSFSSIWCRQQVAGFIIIPRISKIIRG
jgi:hypothetical protein